MGKNPENPEEPTPARGVLDPAAPPYRRFRTAPTGEFVKAVIEHIKATGQPETFDGLYRGRLPSEAKYRIIWRITIDQKKRPDADRAPCPMCTPNRFLSGCLVWLYELQVVAVIGHCCADHAAEAEREFEARELKRQEEDFIWAALPRVPDKIDTLIKLKPAAKEALRIYRRFRRSNPSIQHHLRAIKDRAGARLRVFEIIKTADADEGTGSDYFGPKGFRGRGQSETETRDIDLGMMVGTTALIRDYNPVKEIDDLARVLASLESGSSDESALEFIVGLSDKQRHAASALLQDVDKRYPKIVRRLADFAAFFSPDNIKLLNTYGQHPLNPFRFEAERGRLSGQTRVTFRCQKQECTIVIGAQIGNIDFTWDIIPYGNAGKS
jgi:hypothetical protein